MTDEATEAHRRACEARHYLRQGHNTPVAVDALLARVESKRGAAAARSLHEEMRLQWKNRCDWWGVAQL